MNSKLRNVPITLVALAMTLGAAACSKKESKAHGTASKTTTAKPGSSTPAPASTLPKTDKAKLELNAAKIVRFFKYEDVEALILMSPPKDRERLKKELEEGSPRYKSLFGEDSWRMKAAQAWNDDKVGPVRVKGDKARVKFGEKDGEVFVVGFVKQAGNWWFDDIEKEKKEAFDKWGQLAN